MDEATKKLRKHLDLIKALTETDKDMIMALADQIKQAAVSDTVVAALNTVAGFPG